MAVYSRLESLGVKNQRLLLGAGKVILEAPGNELDCLENFVAYFNDLYLKEADFIQQAEVFHPLSIRLLINHQPFVRGKQRVVYHKKRFDLELGFIESDTTFASHHGKIFERFQLLIDQKQQNQVLLHYEIQTEESQHLTLQTGVFHALPPTKIEVKDEFVTWRSEVVRKGTKFVVSEGLWPSFGFPYEWIETPEATYREFQFKTTANEVYSFDKIILFSHSNRAEYENPTLRLERTIKKGFDQVFKQNTQFWKQTWKVSGIEIKGDEAVQAGLKQVIYRYICQRPTTSVLLLNQVDENQKSLVSRYCDFQELYRLPFYLNADHESAKAIILHLISTLPLAKKQAQQLEKQGAYYPQISPTGWNHYQNVVVGRSILEYVDRTGDTSIYQAGGLETMLEIARFTVTEINHQGHIVKITTRDPNYPLVDNEAKTNYLVHDFLQGFIETLEWVRTNQKEFYQTFSEKQDAKREIVTYKAAIKRLYVPKPNKNGVLPIFDGFEQGANQKPLICPSVLDIFRLYPERFLSQHVKATFDFYYPLLQVDQPLIKVISGIITHQYEFGRLGFPEFLTCLGIHKRTPTPPSNQLEEEEIYAYLMVLEGFAGLRLHGMIGRVVSSLPSQISSIRFRILHRNKVALIKIFKDRGEWTWES